MRSVRLLVHPLSEAVRAGLVLRLRHATVEPLDRVRPEGDACLLLGDSAPLASLIQAGIPTRLVTAKPSPAEVEMVRSTACDIVNPDRYLPSRQLIRQQLDAGMGQPGLLRLHRWQTEAAPPLRDLDLTRWLMRQAPERVFALANGASLQIHLGFPGGGMALLDLVTTLPNGDGYVSLSVIAASGAVHADDHHNVQLAYRGGRPQALRTEEDAAQLATIAQEWLAHTPGEDHWQAVFALAEAVQQSLTTGRAIALEAA